MRGSNSHKLTTQTTRSCSPEDGMSPPLPPRTWKTGSATTYRIAHRSTLIQGLFRCRRIHNR